MTKNSISTGVALGMLLGLATGAVLHNIVVWSGIGLALGAAFGAVISSRKQSSN
jgi:TPP-dependent 2-oxoacid decarboxylase